MSSPGKKRRSYQQAWRRAKQIRLAAQAAAEQVTREEDILNTTYPLAPLENSEENREEDDRPPTPPPEAASSSESENVIDQEAVDSDWEEVMVSESESEDSLSSDSDDNEEEGRTAAAILQSWALKHGITHNALDDLLREVRSVKPIQSWQELPLSARTLLRTNRSVETEHLGPMERVKLDVKTVITANFLKYPPLSSFRH